MRSPLTVSRSIPLHQLLHGYDGGHKLLAGSLSLPPAAARRILIQSDLAGTIPPEGFDRYLTAYPVPEIECYAFACTWYAPEMPRPGCVWTHTLLIPSARLAALSDLQMLDNEFRRPDTASVRTELYDRALEFTPGLFPEKTGHIPSALALQFLRIFYRADEPPVILAAASAEEFSSLFHEAWAQLWPAARLRLTLSTGSLAARKLDGRPFDLQVTARSTAREVVRSASGVLLENTMAGVNFQADENWLRPVLQDLIGEVTDFRGFLHAVADEDLGRGDVPGVAAVYLLFKERAAWTEQSLPELFTLVADKFPEARRAQKLKRTCLELANLDQPRVSRWLILHLASHDYGEAFSSPALGLEDGAWRFLGQDKGEAAQLLAQLLENSLNPFGEELVRRIVAGLDQARAIEFLTTHPQFVSTLIRLRPELAADSEVWTVLQRRSHDILAAVAASARENPALLRRIFPAFFASGLDHQAGYFVELFDVAAIAAIFSHRGPLPVTLHDRWLDAVAAKPQRVLAYLADTHPLSREVLSGVAATLTPRLVSRRDFPMDEWLRVLREWEPSFSPMQGGVIETCAFSLALALQEDSEAGAELAALSFETVHTAAAMQSLPPLAWAHLEPIVPSISWFKDWDLCERLRRGLVLAFANGKWPVEYLAKTLKTPALFRDVLESAWAIPEGKRLLELLENANQRPAQTLSVSQIAALSEVRGKVRKKKSRR